MNEPLCIYHAGCADGFCAAWIVAKAYPGAELLSARYGDEPPDVTGRDVMVVDFSYHRDVMVDMQRKSGMLLVLDHHKSAQKHLAGLDFCAFHLDKCGAMLTWMHCFPNDPPPALVQYVQDRDLWRWKLDDSKAISASIAVTPHEIQAWDNLYSRLRHDTKAVVAEGEAILAYQARQIEAAVRRSSRMDFAGHDVPVVNTTSLMSEIGHELCDGEPFAVMWWVDDGAMKVSLRSNYPAEGAVDVSEIAAQLGGGGHPAAAGCRLELTEALLLLGRVLAE
jgi:oligoribonuclease NrnB/cAMP/cGMP phosphodiesterase (DHH superfamily)